MKLFAFILSFLMIGLSVLPCPDEDFMCETGKTESGIHKEQDRQQDHENACSPFCHCTCCAGFSITHIFPALTSLIQANTLLYPSYLQGNLIEYSSSVWQPPKIG